MLNQVKVMAFAIAGILVIGQVENGWAFKIKNPLLQENTNVTQPAEEPTEKQTPAAEESASTAQEASVSKDPFTYTSEKFGYKVELPSRWQQMSGDAKSNAASFFDEQGNKGSFQVNATWMSSDFPVQASLQAISKQNDERIKHGELQKQYRKDFSIKDKNGKSVVLFQGYVTIETADDPDPDIRRMQWIGYGKGNYYNFTWASNKERFESYVPEFEQILGKIQFDK